MPRSTLSFVLTVIFCHSALNANFTRANGQLETPPTLFKAGVDDQGREFFLNGQPAQRGKLILTASNGFFDKGTCRAEGDSTLPKVGDNDLIKPNFAFLGHWKSTEGTIRWHVWIPQRGRVRLRVKMKVAKSAAGSQVTVSLAGRSQTARTMESDSSQPQGWNLVFDVLEPGEHTLTMSARKITDPSSGVGQLHQVDLDGPAIDQAQLLRARWRPAAVHGRYSCSNLNQSRTWVMTTRSVSDCSSYSPITTPFGYFGTSFDADRRSNGSFNFSMWAAGSRGIIPPLEHMPHLLASGSPEAVFSGFGHEGSGVKLREWTPMPDRPTVVVQALRVITDGQYDTYYGYFWDHPSHHWKLYAIGRKWNGGTAKEHLSPGSFCEIPGPPHVQRSGDQVREVRRRGWHFGDDNQWHPMDTFHCKSKGPVNQYWRTTDDGEFAMGTGGMRYYAFRSPSSPARSIKLPEFLTPEATRQLDRLPADFGQVKTEDISSNAARIKFYMVRSGANARAEIHYGETDCLTFGKRKLHGTERRSAVSQSTQKEDRCWQNSLSIASVQDGENRVSLANLKPDTTYHFRIRVTNDDGKLWSFKTQTFHTSNK